MGRIDVPKLLSEGLPLSEPIQLYFGCVPADGLTLTALNHVKGGSRSSKRPQGIGATLLVPNHLVQRMKEAKERDIKSMMLKATGKL